MSDAASVGFIGSSMIIKSAPRPVSIPPTDVALAWLVEKLNLPLDGTSHGTVDVVLSDMAPNTVGHKKTDHIRQMVLLEYAFDFAIRSLKHGGTFVAKSFTGGTTGDLLKQIKERFETVHHIKPPASRDNILMCLYINLKYDTITIVLKMVREGEKC